MPVFAVQYSYVDDPELVTEHRPAHRDFLRDLLDQGIVLAAGAYTDGPAGALLVFRARQRAGRSRRCCRTIRSRNSAWCRTARFAPGVRPWGPGPADLHH